MLKLYIRNVLVDTLLTESFDLVFRHSGLKYLICCRSSVVWEETLTWTHELSPCEASWNQLLLLLTGRHPNPLFPASVESRGAVSRNTLKKSQPHKTRDLIRSLFIKHLRNSSLNCPLIIYLVHKKSWMTRMFITQVSMFLKSLMTKLRENSTWLFTDFRLALIVMIWSYFCCPN